MRDQTTGETAIGEKTIGENTMRAAVLNRPMVIEVKDVKMPTVQADEALIRVHCIGVCGSDIHYYEHGRIGRYVVKQPLILGHELAGDVVTVGSKVTSVKPGDRVAVEPGIPCDRCQYCKAGRYNLCPNVEFMATPPIDGAWAQYVSVRADFLHKLPETLSYEEGALLEPLSVGIHAMRRGRVAPGDRVLVSGLGPVGILAGVAAKMFGASQVIGTDVMPFRLDVALRLGFDGVLNPQTQNVSEEIDRITAGAGVTAIVETSGNAKAVSDSVEIVNVGGRVIFIGLPTSNSIAMDVPKLVDKEIDIYGVFRYANTYPMAIEALSKGSYNIRDMITQSYQIEDVKEACEMARTQKDSSIKVMIYPNGGEH